MAFQLSPGVNVSEIDLTTVVPSVATSVGAFAGPFSWGPVGEVVTISDEVRLVERFGKPDSTNYENWFSAANFLAYSNNLKVVRASGTGTLNASANGAGVLIKNEDDYTDNYSTANTSLGPVAARYAGAFGNSLRVSICPSPAAFSSNLTVTDSMRANALNTLVDNQFVINVNGTANAAANVQAGDQISVDAGVSYIRVASVNATAIVVASALTANVAVNTAILRRWQYADQFGVAPGTSDYATAAGGSNDELHVIVVDEDGKFSNGIANTVLEKFGFVSKASDAKTNDGSSNYYVNALNDRSRYVWWTSHISGNSSWGSAAAGTTFDAANGTRNPVYASLAGGADGTITAASTITAYGLFVNPDSVDISLVVSGSADATVEAYLISSLAEVRKDCLVFLSPSKASVVDNAGSELTSVIAYRDALTSTSYAVMDSGYKYQFDKYNDVYRWVPLNGDIAGICARTDLERDPWFSPGGVNRGIVKNVIKMAWNPTKAERDNLYVKGVNPVVTFPGEGTILFGDKTMLARPSVFDRINVRRLFVVLEKSIARAARSSMFEFNDQFTRAQFVNLVEPYLRDIQGRRGITDFRVVCDETNNTANVIDSNQFVGDIYIKPARSINFIQLNFVAVRTGVTFEEVVGRF
jgi:phage tail sheath protein FI